MKILEEIIKGLNVRKVYGSTDIPIEALQFDSREVSQHNLFVAQKGTLVDGHNYIEKAVKQGATAIICEELPQEQHPHVTYLLVEKSSEALACVASNFYDNPSQKIKLVGVTGTNGKTTIVTLLYRMFRQLGYKVGLLSTICNYLDDEKVPSTHTTPDSLQLNRLLSQMVELGCEYCFMEVSSHAISQNRTSYLHFSGGTFTNLSHDHLDYHKTFAAYIKAKKKFFDELPASSFVLINLDDKNGQVMLQNTRARQYSYALKSIGDYNAKILERHFDSTFISIDNTEVWIKFIGDFNTYNILAVYAVSRLLGASKEEILHKLSLLEPVDGRFDSLASDDGVIGIVDYAHTPDALLNVLATVKKMAKPQNQIITVVGAGGDRDKTKRPEMARIAAESSTKVILTSDNPRTENPQQIIEDMKEGLDTEMSKQVLAIENRREAIRTACALARPGDIILVAGKGHENYQDINGKKNYFNDKEELTEALKR